MNPYTLERIENWVGDYCAADAIRGFSGGTREFAADVLVKFMVDACEARGIEPDDIEEADVRTGLLGRVAKLELPKSVRSEVPALCGSFLESLEREGRLGGGSLLAAYARALKNAFEESGVGKVKPIVRPGSRLGRNDPCPCGSGRKYKKCCMNE